MSSVLFSPHRYFNQINDTSLDFLDLLDELQEKDSDLKVFYPEEYIKVVTGAQHPKHLIGDSDTVHLLLNGRMGLHFVRLARKLAAQDTVKHIHLYLACFSFQQELNHISQTLDQIFRENDTENTEWTIHHYPISGMEHIKSIVDKHEKRAKLVPRFFLDIEQFKQEMELPFVTDNFDLAIVDVARMPGCVYQQSGLDHIADRLQRPPKEDEKDLVIFTTKAIGAVIENYKQVRENRVYVVSPCLFAADPGDGGMPMLPDYFIPHCDRLIFPATKAFTYNRWIFLAKSFGKEVISDQPC